MSCGLTNKTCNINTDGIREYFTDTIDLMFLSSSGQPIEDSHSGIIKELERLCNTSNLPIERYLRPISETSILFEAKECYLEKIEFFAYDTTILNGEGQNEETTLALYQSKTTDDAFAQSSYRYSLMPINFQPNFFRPKMFINGVNLLRGMAANNKADSAIGIPLPYCYERYLNIGKVNSIEIYAAYAQKINNGYLNYPILAIATFWCR